MSFINTKNILLIIVAGLMVGGAFYFNEYRNKDLKKEIYESPITATSSSITFADSDIDTDNDGLKDWEESLWGTNPNSADTDGDGTGDNAEVLANRNPLIKKTAKQDDKYNPTEIAKAGPVTKQEELTLTETFGRDVFSRYVSLKQSGLFEDAQSKQTLINKLLSDSAYDVSPKIYSEKDLIISSETSIDAIRKYGNIVSTIFVSNNTDARNEGVIVKESLEKENPAVLSELDPIILSYRTILKGLLSTSAPKDMAIIHKGIVNAVSRMLFVDESLRKADADPIIALQGLGIYQESSKQLLDSMLKLQDFLRSSGVVYKNTESGFIFNKK